MRKRNLIGVVVAGGIVLGGLALPALAQTRGPKDGKPRMGRVEDAERGWHAEHGGNLGTGRGFGPERHGPPPGMGFGHGPGHGPGHMAGPPELAVAARSLFPFWENEELVAELGLSEEQVTALAESLELTQTELEKTEGSIADATKALMEELKKDAPDLQTVYGLSDAVSNARNGKARIILGHAVTVKTVLTTEQEEALKEAGPGMVRERMREVMGLRDEIREEIRNGGTLEDVEKLLEEKDIPDFAHEMILKRVEEACRRMEADMERMEMPQPPDRPEPPGKPRRPARE